MSDDPTLVPEYEFEWSDGSTRSTDEIDIEEVTDRRQDFDLQGVHDAFEHLAEVGRNDPECDVTLKGFAN